MYTLEYIQTLNENAVKTLYDRSLISPQLFDEYWSTVSIWGRNLGRDLY